MEIKEINKQWVQSNLEYVGYDEYGNLIYKEGRLLILISTNSHEIIGTYYYKN